MNFRLKRGAQFRNVYDSDRLSYVSLYRSAIHSTCDAWEEIHKWKKNVVNG